ncbi:hypothetical protein D6792_02835 [Candidatus Parcubacteria bacterium]|nr:MAG: hypothetical protein D6792_02835 [Candidatus Parcubacteria bacterium]
MRLSDLERLAVPEQPGVYLFLDQRGKPLYIGKAAVLRDRVRSYFREDLAATRGERVAQAVAQAATLEWRVCANVLEALLLEAALIRQYKPPGNARQKDDKSYWVVVITNEKWPRVLLVRAQLLAHTFDASHIRKVYGPFPHGGEIKEALRIIKNIFPFFDTKRPVGDNLSPVELAKLRFYQSLGLSPSSDEMALRRYQATIRNICRLFEGKKNELVSALRREMRQAAAAEDFEYAAKVRDQIASLEHIRDIALLKRAKSASENERRVEAYDIAHHAGKEAVGVMVVREGGNFIREAYRTFLLKEARAGDDPSALREVVTRRLRHPEWRFPDLIVVDGAAAQVRVVEAAVAGAGLVIPVVGVVKDERHKPLRIIGKLPVWARDTEVLEANAEAHRFAIGRHRRRQRKVLA